MSNIRFKHYMLNSIVNFHTFNQISWFLNEDARCISDSHLTFTKFTKQKRNNPVKITLLFLSKVHLKLHHCHYFNSNLSWIWYLFAAFQMQLLI